MTAKARALPIELAIEGLGKRYGEKWVVSEVGLVVAAGRFLSIVGPSGCGKSTTLRLIAGLDTPDSGEIRIGGVSVSSSRRGVSVPPERRNIGFVFQSYALWPHMTVFEHTAYPLQSRGGHKLTRAVLEERVDGVLELVGLTAERDRYPSELSGGQQQRVALARAVVQEPAILLLDEPLSNLDAALRLRMGLELRSLQRRLEITTIYVTHDRIEALSLSDEIMVMNDGRSVDHGGAKDVYEFPRDLFSARFVSGANILRGVVDRREDDTLQVQVAAGVTLTARMHPRAPAPALNQEVWLVARPESINLASADARPELNGVVGAVENITYFGGHSDLVAQVAGSLITARVNSSLATGIRRGQLVTFVMPVKSLVVLPVA
jgi:iron(III) transport system ATP-binding protein